MCVCVCKRGKVNTGQKQRNAEQLKLTLVEIPRDWEKVERTLRINGEPTKRVYSLNLRKENICRSGLNWGVCVLGAITRDLILRHSFFVVVVKRIHHR